MSTSCIHAPVMRTSRMRRLWKRDPLRSTRSNCDPRKSLSLNSCAIRSSWHSRDDRRGEGDPVVLGPRWSERLARSAQDVVRPLAQDVRSLTLDGSRLVEVNLPPAGLGDLGEDLPVHDTV